MPKTQTQSEGRAFFSSRVLLLGNPNVGKTTLFNRLCGLRSATSNFPGSTVEARIGTSSSNGYDSKPGSLVATENITWTSPGSGTATLTTITAGEMEPMTGEIIYIENRAPVTRASDQTEDIKLIIEF